MKAAKLLLLFIPMALTSAAWAQTDVPIGARWLEHLNKDLLPFWSEDTALGNPVGAFPSVRCDDGSLYDPRRPCREVASGSQHQRYLVSLSRQSFGYGVAFHLTGNRAYLNAMKAGIDFIRQNAMDRVNGGMKTTQNLSKDTWGPSPELRTPQQLAYGLLGMAFYYYLTRDADVLRDVLTVKDYIFGKYGASPGALQWQPLLGTLRPREDKHLVAQLDQMNTYLVLLTPLLPEPTRGEWKESLVRVSKVMIDQFYSPADRLFFLSANQPQDRDLALTPTDFGHNAKALWMIRWTGLITGHSEFVAFAQDNAKALFQRAYLNNCGCWGEGLLAGGAVDLNTAWWTYAELDQLAGTLATVNIAFAQYLSSAYDYWFTYFVDKEHGEVWNGVDGKTHAPNRKLPKEWEWKNAYHSFEHALVGYIVGQQLNNLPVTLYYALPDGEAEKSAAPYYFSGTRRSVEVERDSQERPLQKVTFDNVR